MEINVAQLLREHVGSVRDYEIDETADLTGEGRESPLKGQVGLMRTPNGVLAECSVDTEVELSCSRCLSRFRRPLRVDFTEEYQPTVDLTSGAPLPPPEDAGTFVIDGHHILDLNEAIRQYALMKLPMKPLCRKDCAGLCPTCGRNLNLGRCDCPTESIDPRWSALSKLR